MPRNNMDKSPKSGPNRRITQCLRDFLWDSGEFTDEAKADIVGWIDWLDTLPGGPPDFRPVDSTTIILNAPKFRMVIGYYWATLKRRVSEAEAARDRAFSACRRSAKKNMTKPTKDDVMMTAHTDKAHNDAVDKLATVQQHLDVVNEMRWALPPALTEQYANNERMERKYDSEHP